jgi:A/G-specific adenine glycosylase
MSDESQQHRRIARRLLRWFTKAQRDLPWRRTRDSYLIWLSEVMLQQTRVETVIPYYERFVDRFPTVDDLAAADVDDVLALWAGLGYYGRARSLHRAARQIVSQHGGTVPKTLHELQALPGVGRYTAGAVASIAYGVRAPVLDGNVERVLCRLFAVSGNPKGGSTRKRLWTIAEALLPRTRPGDLNQALMELGATVCTPREPLCGQCPVRVMCRAFEDGRQLDLPQLPKRKEVPHFDIGLGIVWRRQRLLIAKRPYDAMLGGLWEFPGGKRRDGETLRETVRREVEEETGLRVRLLGHLTTCRHAYSHFRVTLHAYDCTSPRGRARPLGSEACRWVTVAELPEYPFPSGSMKVIRSLQERMARGSGPAASSGSA